MKPPTGENFVSFWNVKKIWTALVFLTNGVFYRRAISLVISITFATHLNASPSIEAYGTLPFVNSVRLSHSGNYVAVSKTVNNVDSIEVYSLKDKKLIGGANLGDLSVYNLYFISDEQLIFNAGKVRQVFGYEGDFRLQTSYILDLKTDKIRQLLIPGKGIRLGQTGLGSIAGLTKDRKFALMPAVTGKDNRDPTPEYSLMKVSLLKVKRPSIVERGSNHTYNYFVDNNGELLAELRYNQASNLHQIFSFTSGNKKEIYAKEEPLTNFSVIGLTPDQKSLVVKLYYSNTDRIKVHSMSLTDGEISKSPLFAREDADVDHFYRDVHNIVYGVSYSGFNPSYEFFEEGINTQLRSLTQALQGQSVWLHDWSADKKKLAIEVEGTLTPGDFFLVNQKNELEFFEGGRPFIPTDAVHPITEINYKARDGLNIPTLLTIPKGKEKSITKLPAVMLPHGGPAAFDTIGFDYLAQALANEGYLVIQPQFRGSSGFGIRHKKAGRGEWGKKMQTDLEDGIDYLVGKGMIDPKRICIVGGSYGGYAALAGAAFSNKHYKCSVSINGVSDLYAFLKDKRRSSNSGKYSSTLTYFNIQWTGEDSVDKELLKSISPAQHAKNINIPILLIHGEEDLVVSIEQSKKMHKALKKEGKNVNFISLKGDDHYLSKSETRIETLKAITSFLKSNL